VNLSVTSTQLLPPRLQQTTQIPTLQGTTINIIPPAPQAGGLAVVAVPRQNSIILAVPRARVRDVLLEIARLDVPPTDAFKLVPFPLKRASAQQVSQQVQIFWNQRYPDDRAGIKATFDPGSNTVFVQAAPGDLAEIRDLIEWM